MRLLCALAFCMMFTASARAGVIDMAGSVNATGQDQGGEFADYTGATAGSSTPIATSSVNDGVVSLSVVDTGAAYLATAHATGYVYSAGAEINFANGANATSAATALSGNGYLDLVITSAGLGVASFDLTGISVSVWRNGTNAAANYQLFYDDENDGFDAGDALGTPTNLPGHGSLAGVGHPTTPGTISYNATPIATDVTSATARLYFWTAGNASGNSHLFNVTANYVVVPEPGASVLVLLGGSVLALRRWRAATR